MSGIWRELSKRKVFRVAGAYGIVGWLALQLTGVLATLLDTPDWIGRLVILLVILCFPLVMVLAWAFNITPDGVVRDNRSVVRKYGLRVDYALLGTLLLITGWALYQSRVYLSPQETENISDVLTNVPGQAAASGLLDNSVAILPFENLSPDPDNAYFAAGLHEEILSQVARVRDLSVISRTSVLQYANQETSIPEVASELRVEAVMEGSARFANDKVRIQVTLIDGETDQHIWVEVFQRDLVDIFAIQAEIAQRVAAAMQAEFLPSEMDNIEKRPTESIHALTYYLKAVSMDWSNAQRNEALSLLNEAVESDADFAPALGLRALVNATALNNNPGDIEGWSRRHEQIELSARSDAEKALRLDPILASAHVALARIYQYHWRGEGARRAYERGLQSNPNSIPILRGYAWFNSVAGNHTYAIELAERAVELDPRNAAAYAELGQRHTFAGNREAALSAHRRAVELSPTNGIYRLRVANNEIALGATGAAIDQLRIAETFLLTDASTPETLAELAYAYARSGNESDAHRIVDKIEALSSERVVGLGAWAMAHLALMENDKALENLRMAASVVIEQGVLDGGFKALAQIAANSLADPILEQPEFRDVRARLTFVD